jgi:hypothetical protein
VYSSPPSGAPNLGHRNLPVLSGRVEGVRLRRLAEQAQSNPLFQALLDWIDGAVVILNPERQILLASDEVARLVGVADPRELLGRRYGEALSCVHVSEGSDGCGTSNACQFCGALRTILKGQTADVPVESECRITLDDELGMHSVKFEVRASRATGADVELTVLVFRRAVETTPTLRGSHPLRDHTADWPSDALPAYRVRKLGVGGMGSVFLVRGTDGHEYALKTIRPEQVTEHGIVDRFVREMNVATSLNHCNIVRTYRAEQTPGGTFYMMSEYCPGGSAEQWLQNRGPLAPDLAFTWLSGVARAIEYAWTEHQLVHRDIKPDNLLLDASGRPKLTDFGVAKRVRLNEHKLTSAGTVVGSVPYMAPEQALGLDTVDTRADLYAVGSTFFELLTGSPPFDGPTPTALLGRKLTENPPSLARVRPTIPGTLAQSVDWLLRREPNERPADATHFLQHLRQVADHEQFDFDDTQTHRSV